MVGFTRLNHTAGYQAGSGSFLLAYRIYYENLGPGTGIKEGGGPELFYLLPSSSVVCSSCIIMGLAPMLENCFRTATGLIQALAGPELGHIGPAKYLISCISFAKDCSRADKVTPSGRKKVLIFLHRCQSCAPVVQRQDGICISLLTAAPGQVIF